MINYIKNKLDLNDNIIEIVQRFLVLNQIKISKTTVENEIFNHPEYPSLLAITDFFNEYGIENSIFTPTTEQLAEGFYPCIIQIESQINKLKYFSIIKNITDGYIEFYDPNKHKWVKMLVVDFDLLYQGIVFMIEPPSEFAEPDFKLKVQKESREIRLLTLLLLFIPLLLSGQLIFNYTKYHLHELSFYIYNLLSYAGVLLSCLLILFEVDDTNPIFQKVCGSKNNITDCSSVLKSSGASLFGIKYTYIGFCHFSTILLIAVLSDINTVFGYLKLTSLLISPFIIYSLIYQWKIAKKWCVTCLSIQGVIFLQAIFFVVNPTIDLSITPILLYIIQFVLIWGFLYLSVNKLLPIFKLAAGYKQLNMAYQRSKYQHGVFWHLLNKQSKVTTDDTLGIWFTKNTDPDTPVATMVCNPYCSHCAEAHKFIDKLYQQGKLNLNIIFNSSVNEADIRYKPTKHLLFIANTRGESAFFKALKYWYSIGMQNYAAFEKLYPTPLVYDDDIDKQIAQMNLWCYVNEVQFTPTVFINGHQLSSVYTFEELKYALE